MRPVLAAVLIGIGIVASAGGAEAATNQARNRCGDAIRILRSNPTIRDFSGEVDPLEVDNLTKHWNQVIDGWNRASKQIDQIPKADLDEKDPELADCFTEVRKWGAYVKALDARIKESQALAKLVIPFLEEVKPLSSALWPLVIAHYGKADLTSNNKPEFARRIMDDLGKVEAACTKHVPAMGTAMPELTSNNGASNSRSGGGVSIPASFALKPNVWCFVAKNRKDLMTKALAQTEFSAPGFGNYSIMFPEALKAFGEGRTSLSVWVAMVLTDPAPFKAALTGEAKAWYAAAGIEAPATLFPKLDEVLTTLRTAAEAAAAKATFEDTKIHDKTLEALGRATIKKYEPSSKILASAMDAKDFTITKNRMDFPTDRFRSGHVLMKRPKAPWCEQRTFSYVETYQGGGKYQKSSTASVTEGTKLIRCP